MDKFIQWLLSKINVATIVDFVIDRLEAAVNDPQSPEAMRLRAAVAKLRSVADDFLFRVP